MDRSHVEFIRSVLPQGRTLFYTYRDHYAVYLLRKWMGDQPMPLHELKRSPVASLLQKPVLKPLLAAAGNGVLDPRALDQIWPSSTRVYRLGLGVWPSLDQACKQAWDQVTREGRNLVLQLNMNSEHKRQLERYIPSWKEEAHYDYHPVACGEELTLAWSRIDLDLDQGEALIEEIQSDWVRDVRWCTNYRTLRKQWAHYEKSVLQQDARDWPQVMLCATLWFLFEELGIRRVFYHRHETGARMKAITHSLPPRSLYTRLPEQFGFQLTHNGPGFIRDGMNRRQLRRFCDPATQWYVLQV